MKGKTNLGFLSALGSGVAWSIDTILIGIILAKSPFIDTEKAIVLAPFVSTFLHDAISAIWVSIYNMIRGEFKDIFKAVTSRSGRYIMLAALMAGPLGMTAYMLSIKYIGSAYAASITAFYPALGALLAFIFLKEPMNGRIWSGIILSIIGVIILGYSPSEISATGTTFLLGIGFALLTVVGWALESVICAYGMKDDVTPEQALNIRQMTSGIFYAIILMPILKGYPIVIETVKSFNIVTIGITALVGTMSYLFYYNAINLIGAARSTALNITYSMWAIVIQVLFMGMKLNGQLLLGSVVVITGSILVAVNPKELLGFDKKVI